MKAYRELFALPALLACLLAGCANHAQTVSAQGNHSTSSAALAPTLSAGTAIPHFAYHLTGGATLSPNALQGHPYMLWIMATWCSSCQGGTDVLAHHIAQLRAHDVRVVQLEAADDLGAPGPPLSRFRTSVGMVASSPNWYWGEATVAQMQALDPNGYPDIYYLVNGQGRIVEINGAPAATWHEIAKFAKLSV